MRLARRPGQWAASGMWVLASFAACSSGGGFSGADPVALLATSPQADAAFDAVRQAWANAATPPSTLRALIENFLERYPSDGLAPLSRVALSLVALRQQDLREADRQLTLTEGLAPGSAKDLWTVARAKRLRLGGEADRALALLRPLVGKSVDPLGRTAFEEELTLTALATHRDYEAISYMDAWLRASTDEERAQTADRVRSMVERLSKDVLVGALQAMRAQRASLGYGVDIERILSERLVQIATTSGDAPLARMLVDADAGAIAIRGDAGVVLGELATSRLGVNVVAGRTVGLLLPTGSPELRDESADVLRGVMWALGLPHGIRDVPAAGSPDAGVAANRVPRCAELERAPEVDEPTPQEDVRLVTHEDAGRSDRTEASLDELAGEGASLVIAGFDGHVASRAIAWSESHAVPVVALVAPEEGAKSPSFGFVLGEPRSGVLHVLSRAAPGLENARIAPVADASELPDYPPQGGLYLGLHFGPPVACDVAATRAGDPRFPITPWNLDKTSAWLVSGSPSCANDVLAELTHARVRGIVALTLEAAAMPAHMGDLHVVTAQAGVVPLATVDDPRREELARFSAALGPISWWTALGRDASMLARLSVRELPLDEVSDPAAVASRRRRARDSLVTAHARLWTTQTTGWGSDHTLKRTVCALDVPAR